MIDPPENCHIQKTFLPKRVTIFAIAKAHIGKSSGRSTQMRCFYAKDLLPTRVNYLVALLLLCVKCFVVNK